MSPTPFGAGLPLVIDTSAWNRQGHDRYRERWKATARADRLVACSVSSLEILGNARSEQEFAALDAALRALPQAPVNVAVCQAALAASRELRGSRLIPAADYLIAAAAAERGFGVLHADRHFDLLATVLPFESVRLPD